MPNGLRPRGAAAPRATSLCVVAMVLAASARASTAQSRHADCGTASLTTLLSLLAVEPPEDAVRRWEETFAQSPASMADLRGQAEALGVRLQGVACTLEELAGIRGPAILHLGHPGHFVVTLNQGGGWPQVIDGSRLITDRAIASALLARFSGKALIVDQGGAAEGPSLHIAAPVAELEPSAPGVPVLARFDLTNEGPEPLRILEVTAGCGVAVACDAQILAPGAGATVIARHGGPGPGRYAFHVRIATDDPYRRVAYLCLSGSALPAAVLAVPDRLMVMSRPDGRSVPREFHVVAPSGMHLAATARPSGWVDVSLDKASDDGVAARWDGAIRVAGDAGPGRRVASVRIVDNGTGELQATVRVALEVPLDLVSSPRRVYFGFVRQGEAAPTARLTLGTRSGVPAEVEEVAVSDDGVICTRTGAGAYLITVPADRAGVVSGSVRFTARGRRRETLDVPVYAQVVK